MEEQLQQEYLRLLEVLNVKDKIKRDYVDYKQILNVDFSKLNPKTQTYKYLKEIKERLTDYMNSLAAMSHSDVLQLTYPDHNKVKAAVSTALQNIASEPYGKVFCEFINAFDEPALELINKQTSLFDDVDLRNRYPLYKGVLCFANCLKDYLPFSDEKNSMTYVLYFVLERLKNEFNTKELYYLYEAKVDENKKLHIEDKYTDFLENCLNRNKRLFNLIKPDYKSIFNPEILLFQGEPEKLINLNNPRTKSFNEIKSLIQPFFTEVENILFNENLPNLVDGKDTWLHRLEKQKVKVVPFEVDEELSLAKKFEIALWQAAQFLKDQKSNSLQYKGRVLERFLEDGVTIDNLDSKTGSERKKQILCDFVQRNKVGITTYGGLEFSAELKSQIEEVIKTFIYQPKAEFVKTIGIEREQIFYLLTFAFRFKASDDVSAILLTNIKQQKNKGAVDKNIRCLKNSLRELLFPASKEIILADVEEKVNIDKSEGEFMSDVILASLDNDPSIEQIGDGLYQLKKEELGSAYLIQGRIMYEINDWRTFREIEEIFRQQFPENKEKFLSSYLLKFESKVSPSMGFICMGKTGKWRFTEDKNGHEDDVYRLLENLLKEKEIVTIDEVMDLVRDNDMPYELETIRSYLLGMCFQDESGTVFVLSDKKDEHPEYSWKRKNRAGTTNWTVNCAVDILQKQPSHKMAYKEFREKLLHFAKEEGYRSAVINIINSKPYNGEDKLFIQKNGFIELNQSVLDNTDLKFEGLYRKDPHFMDIFSYTFNALSHEEESQLPLTELVKRITNQDGVSISETTIRHAFDQNSLLPDGLERLTVEGRVFVRLVNAKAIDEDEQYKVDNTVSSATDEAPSLMVDTTDRPAVTYQTVFNWKSLRKIMKSELAFYENWDEDNSIISEESLDKFQRFMEGSTNSNLSQIIPQDMYDNWFAFTNRFSIYHYFMDLALNFEGLLVDICRRNGKEVAGNGLSEVCKDYYPEYYNVIVDYDVTTGTRYNKIMNSLHINRKQIIDGDARLMEMTSIQMMTNVLNYIALYIRTVVKYYKG